MHLLATLVFHTGAGSNQYLSLKSFLLTEIENVDTTSNTDDRKPFAFKK